MNAPQTDERRPLSKGAPNAKQPGGLAEIVAQVRVAPLESALELIGAGWAVFPCVPTGPKAKSPLTPNGFHDATTEPHQIRWWWARWPHALIGAPVPESLLVLDIDPRNGGSVEELVAVLGPLPETLTTWSGRRDGGRHLYFRRPPCALSARRLPAGVDLKQAGRGYCIVPPSLHPVTGQPYVWGEHPVARLPYAAVLALTPTPPSTRSRWEHVSPGSAAGLVQVVAEATEGTRNEKLYWATCRSVDESASPIVIGELLAAAMLAGLTRTEAVRTIASAQRRVGGAA